MEGGAQKPPPGFQPRLPPEPNIRHSATSIFSMPLNIFRSSVRISISDDKDHKIDNTNEKVYENKKDQAGALKRIIRRSLPTLRRNLPTSNGNLPTSKRNFQKPPHNKDRYLCTLNYNTDIVILKW